MNERLEAMKRSMRAGEHHRFRKTEPISILAECEAEGLSWPRRIARLTVRQCRAETPVIEADEADRLHAHFAGGHPTGLFP